ncbi:uncharacterized protein [Pocillopora verrucosa]|uniref:uncharacterized protein isoform X1 n=1 Tax=Pocillopora verrucosa TaxID=203993 RepID=UPI0033416417
MFTEHMTVFIFVGLSIAQVSQTTALNMSTPAQFKPTSATPQRDCRVDEEPTADSSCGRYTIQLQEDRWNASLNDSSSTIYQDLRKNLTDILCDKLKIYSPMVMFSEVTFKKAAGDWPIAKVKVCLVLIDMEALLHSYTKKYTYEAVGVTFSEWKPKDGECKKCDGGGGPFVVEGVCKKKEHSCRGHKYKSKDSKDCVTYCPSASSLVVAAVSNLILAMWISISYNF